METLLIILSVLGLVFGLLGFVAACVTGVIVLGWRASTHQVIQVPTQETKFEIDAPPHIRDQLPSSPEPETLEQWMRKQRANATSLDSLYEQDL